MTNTAKRRTPGWLGALVICAVFGPALASAQTQNDVRTQKAGRLASEVRIDGILDEPVWAEADGIQDLTMIEPAQGGGRRPARRLARESRCDATRRPSSR